MAFSIEPEPGKREDFAEYRYRILRDGQLVARYWTDFRGDDHGIDFIDGNSQSWPVGNLLDFIQGGGSKPVTLTPGAIAYLEEHAPAGTGSVHAPTPPPPPPPTPPPLPTAAVVPAAAPGASKRKLVVLAALAAWLACLFLPPLQIADRDSSGWGLAYLLTGWMGPLAGHFEWFANPLLFVAAFALWRGHAKTAFVVALTACLLIMLLPLRGTIYADEGGHRQTIEAFRLGFWLWLAAPALITIGAMANLRPERH